MKRIIPLALCFLLIISFAFTQPVFSAGETITWTGDAGDGLWHTAGNWNPAQVPGDGDLVKVEGVIPVAPTAPQDFIATPGDGQVMLSWIPPDNNGGSAIRKYQVAKDDGENWIDVGLNTSYTFTGLTNDTEYTFKVRAVNGVGAGAEATVTATPTVLVCEITGTGMGYFTLDAALEAVTSGQTIKLFNNITHTSPIQIDGKTIYFELGNYDLLVDTSDNPGAQYVLKVENGGKIGLKGSGAGEFNIRSTFDEISYGVRVEGANSEVTVNNIEVPGGIGVSMSVSGSYPQSVSITVNGNIIAGDRGVEVNAENGSVIVNGDITAGYTGVQAAANRGTEVTVNGNITVIGKYPNGAGVFAAWQTTVTVTGDVIGQGTGYTGIHAQGGFVEVRGDVVSSDIGVKAERGPAYPISNGVVIIHGSLSAGTLFIVIESTEKTPEETTVPTTKEDFLTYTDGNNTVWIGSAGNQISTYTVGFYSDGSLYDSKSVVGGFALGINWPEDPTRTGYNFEGWFAGEDGTGTQYTSSTIVNNDVDLYAKWTPIPDSGNGSSGSSSGRRASQVPAYQATVKTEDGAEKAIQMNVGRDVGTVFLEEDPWHTRPQDKTEVTIPSIPGVNEYSLGLPVAGLSKDDGLGRMTINTGVGSVTVPSNMLAGVPGIIGSKAEIAIGQGDKGNLPEEVKTLIGDRPLISINLSVDGKKINWGNPNAPVTVSIPYTPTAEELANPESIVIWYIDGSGNVVSVPNGRYDSAAGAVTFTTTHLSDFAVAYNPVEFYDVSEDVWCHKAVCFIAAREISKGTGNGNYSPESNLTRGEFIVLMMRAYGMAPDENPVDNFSDAGDTYYTGYLAAAKRLGITSGVGDNIFAPKKQITRQEMITLLHNALNLIDQLPQGSSGKTLIDFNDAAEVAPWAKDAMSDFVESGVVYGSNGKLNPISSTTRAEIAQVLYSLLCN